MAKKITMRDIAEKLNISITTVSRALNNKADVGEDTRKAVLQLANNFDYSPNAIASSLRKSKSNIIGIILPRLEHYFFSTILKGVVSYAQKDNFIVTVGESTHNPKKESELIGELISMNVSGIILSPCRNEINLSYLKALEQNNIPLVLVDRIPKNYQGSYVQLNDFHGAKLAVNHLIQQGYSRIAHIRGHSYSSIAEARFQGYIDTLKLNKIQVDPALIKSCEFVSAEEGYYFTKELMLSPNPPDAIFTVTDEVALGVYDALKELSIDIPNEVGVVGFSNSEVSNYLCPRLSTIDQPGERIGETAYEFLRSAFENSNPIEQKVFEAKLLIRESSVRSGIKGPKH
jgi:LacI family transcriptional regulator